MYTIGFVSNLDPRVEEDLTTLSRSTGATYTWAKNTAELQTIYRRIAGELKTEAGVDTTMDLSFQDIEVNDTPEPGREVFAYRHIEGISTRITSWIDNETGHHVIVQPHTADQTVDCGGRSGPPLQDPTRSGCIRPGQRPTLPEPS